MRLTITAKGIDCGAGFKAAGAPAGPPPTGSGSRPSEEVAWAKWAAMTAAASADTVPGAVLDVRPGLLAPRWEKELYKALVAAPDVGELVRVGSEFEQARPLAVLFETLWEAIPSGNTAQAIDALNWLYQAEYDPAQDNFVQKYLPDTGYTLSIAYGVDVQRPLDRDYMGLLLAELYQADGNVEAAEQLLKQLTPSTVTAVSLAEFYISQRRWADVADLTGNLKIEDEASMYLLIQRGIALREQGLLEESRGPSTKRSSSLTRSQNSVSGPSWKEP